MMIQTLLASVLTFNFSAFESAENLGTERILNPGESMTLIMPDATGRFSDTKITCPGDRVIDVIYSCEVVNQRQEVNLHKTFVFMIQTPRIVRVESFTPSSTNRPVSYVEEMHLLCKEKKAELEKKTNLRSK